MCFNAAVGVGDGMGGEVGRVDVREGDGVMRTGVLVRMVDGAEGSGSGVEEEVITVVVEVEVVVIVEIIVVLI